MFNNNMNIDPITSFSNDQYYTLNSYLIHPQYLSPSTHHNQSLSFHSVSFQSDPFDDIDEENQNHLLPQNHLHSHDNINNILQQQQQQHHYSKPSFLRESEQITSAVLVLPEGTSFCNPTITTSGIFMRGKSPAPIHDDHHQQQLFISSENLGGKKPVSPTHHHHVQPQSNTPTKRGSSGGCGSSSNGKNKTRKDRHSKILITPTTRPRHRRMRLSIDVAREFFDLQDMLGVERASKTVEWLLIKAKPDIDKLRELNNRGSCSTSTSSGLDEEGMNGSGDQSGEAAGSGTSTKPARIKEKKKYTRSKTSKRIVINPFAKEQRERARERARKRTREKMINNKSVEMNIKNNINPSSSSLDQAVLHLVSSCDHDHNHYQHHQHYDDQFAQEPSLIVANTKGWNNLQTSTSTSAAFVDDESCNSNLVNNIHDMGGNLWNPSLVATNSLSNVVSAAATTTTATATATAAFGVPQQDQFSFFGNGWEGCNSQSLGFPET